MNGAHILTAVTTFLLFQAPPARGQSVDGLRAAVGTTVRVRTAAQPDRWLRGTLAAATDTGLTLAGRPAGARDGAMERHLVPYRDIQLVQQSKGRAWWKTALIGLPVGFLVGTSVGYMIGKHHDDHTPAVEEPVGQLNGLLEGAVFGSVLGTVVGALAAPERWTDLSIPQSTTPA